MSSLTSLWTWPSLTTCHAAKLSLLKRNKTTEVNHPPFVFWWAQIQRERDVLASEKGRAWKRETRCEKGEAWFPWFTETGRQTRRLLWVKFGKKKKKGKKNWNSARKMEDFGFDFVLSLGWRNSRSSHLPVWKDLEESDSFCQRKKKRGKEGVSHGSWSGGREREGGQVGIVSPVPLSIHPPWFLFGLLGPMVTKEGVRNVLLLGGCHLQTEGSFVCGALRGWRNSTGPASVEDNTQPAEYQSMALAF